MKGYVSKDVAIDAIDKALSRIFVVPVGADIIGKTPDADVRPVVRGRWISNGYSGARCDQCGNQCHEQFYQNYCPNCGATMTGHTE